MNESTEPHVQRKGTRVVSIELSTLPASLSDLTWPGQVVQSWREFTDAAAEFTVVGQRHLFRGQSAPWELRSSLARALPAHATAEDVLRAERISFDYFRERARLFGTGPLPDQSATSLENSELAWWPIMQHHGAPTRLIDWSVSPFVAAYFATEQSPEDVGVVLVIDANAPTKHSNRIKTEWSASDFRNPLAPQTVRTLRSTTLRERTAAQQGFFTLATNPIADHSRLLGQADAIRRKLVIPNELKPEFLRQLHIMNVTAHTLFGGIDGLGRAAGELIRMQGNT